jgi:5-methylcytosine-specific restriction enzyme A
MVHYKPDSPGPDLWVKEPITSLEALFLEERSLFLKQIVENDIDSEKAQEESYYKDGKATEYYGIRYERNPINRAKELKFMGLHVRLVDLILKKFMVNGEKIL